MEFDQALDGEEIILERIAPLAGHFDRTVT
jgi:hypothetical protein